MPIYFILTIPPAIEINYPLNPNFLKILQPVWLLNPPWQCTNNLF